MRSVNPWVIRIRSCQSVPTVLIPPSSWNLAPLPFALFHAPPEIGVFERTALLSLQEVERENGIDPRSPVPWQELTLPLLDNHA